MTTQPKISVIIPVYNASEHLAECLESLLKQTYAAFEAICINDGSKDDSLEILMRYQNKDSRIRIINQENQGTAKAREKGIKEAHGEWIAYLDADDYVTADYLQKLYACAQKENADAVFCYYYEDRRGWLTEHKKKVKTIKIRAFGKIPYITGACKIIRKKLFQKVCFAENCSFGEDSSISLQIALQRPKIAVLKEYLYIYRRHNGSCCLSGQPIYNKIEPLLRAYKAVETHCKQENIFNRDMCKFLYQKLERQIAEILKEKIDDYD